MLQIDITLQLRNRIITILLLWFMTARIASPQQAWSCLPISWKKKLDFIMRVGQTWCSWWRQKQVCVPNHILFYFWYTLQLPLQSTYCCMQRALNWDILLRLNIAPRTLTPFCLFDILHLTHDILGHTKSFSGMLASEQNKIKGQMSNQLSCLWTLSFVRHFVLSAYSS